MGNRLQGVARWATLLILSGGPALADSALYETGPGQDSSFVRFLNATDDAIVVVAAKGGYRLALGAAAEVRVSKFHPAIAGNELRATIEVRLRRLPIEVVAKPGEYVTVAVVPAGKDAFRVHLLRETPSDYNASRASISLANADPECADAALSGGAANVAIFQGVKPFAIQRRLVNPVNVTAQVSCGGKAIAQALEFGQLQPGERYSAFVIPGARGRAAIVVRDSAL